VPVVDNTQIKSGTGSVAIKTQNSQRLQESIMNVDILDEEEDLL